MHVPEEIREEAREHLNERGPFDLTSETNAINGCDGTGFYFGSLALQFDRRSAGRHFFK
jgi:hypothetical protein